jgi:hypothetical protein
MLLVWTNLLYWRTRVIQLPAKQKPKMALGKPIFRLAAEGVAPPVSGGAENEENQPRGRS